MKYPVFNASDNAAVPAVVEGEALSARARMWVSVWGGENAERGMINAEC